MTSSIYVLGTEPASGKTTVTLGLMEMMLRKFNNVAFFKPIVNVAPESEERDKDIELILSHFGLDMPFGDAVGYTDAVANTIASLGKTDELITGILGKYQRLADTHSIVLCEGVTLGPSASTSEIELDATLCKTLGSTIVLVVNAFEKTSDAVLSNIEQVTDRLTDRGCKVAITIVNRATPTQTKALSTAVRLHERLNTQLVFFLPNQTTLWHPSLQQVIEELEATVLAGQTHVSRHIQHVSLSASHLDQLMKQLSHNSLIVTPGDRIDILLACIASIHSNAMDRIAGIVLTDGLVPGKDIMDLLEGCSDLVPIISTGKKLSTAFQDVSRIHPALSVQDDRKINETLALFDSHVDASSVTDLIMMAPPRDMTPKMFEYQLIQKARQATCRIVLPEGEDERVLRAADILSRRNVAQITLVGDEEAIQGKMSVLGIHSGEKDVIDPRRSLKLEAYAKAFYEMRKQKGITLEQAQVLMSDPTYYSTMMVAQGDAHGMVSGAKHSTANTIRPALQIIKTEPHWSLVSSVFFMGLRDKMLVYGDCAVNPDPAPNHLAEIAIQSALTARAFGIEPTVAMLSYSSGQSGQGSDVDKVREATIRAQEIAEKHYPGLLIDGPIQYDAAVDPTVGKQKMPDSPVAGKATVMIFPDLNTGNNTYKAVQRSAGGTAIGPVLQGLRCPVNDLSRGCSTQDIVNMVAITTIQAMATMRT